MSMSTAPQISPETVRSAAGVIVGFQVAAFTLRINREIAVGDKGDKTWLPPADYVNLASMTITLVGFFIAPIVGIYGEPTAATALGLSLVLLACYPFALAGHYELFNREARTLPFPPFPHQEKVAIVITLLAVLAYIILVVTLRLP
jgi:hypothetical protein